LNELQLKQEEPVRLVFHPEALRVECLVSQLGNVEQLLSEKQEHLAAQLALVALMSTIAKEAAPLRDAIENARRAEDDAHADTNELQRALDELKHTRPHLNALRAAYDQIEQSPDTDALRTQTLDEQTKLGESYEAVERALEDRLDNLKRFNEDAADVEKRLLQLDDSVREQGAASAEADLSLIDAIIEHCNDLRPALDQLADSVQSLCPLIEPVSRVDALSNRQCELNDRLKAFRDDVIRLKDERDAESSLADAVQNAQQALADAERGLEQTQPSTDSIEAFKQGPLRTAAEKYAYLDEIVTQVDTPKIKQLYADKDMLKERLDNVNKRTDEKMQNAQEQDKLVSSLNRKLDDIRQQSDTLSEKYANPQELPIAAEDVGRLQVLLEQVPMKAETESIWEKQLQEQINKRIDLLKSSIKASEPDGFEYLLKFMSSQLLLFQGLLHPLEKDVTKEQELVGDLNNTLAELSSIGSYVVSIDSSVEPTEQLAEVAQFSENLRQLKSKVEKVEEKLKAPERLVRHAPLGEDLSARVTQLQDSLEQKKRELSDRAKLRTLAPEVALITECVQRRLNEIERSPLRSLDDQNTTVQELEAKKQQLESLIESIPAGVEGDDLRERSSWQLGQLNELLKRLSAAVGDKLAALAAFNATKDEVQAQLSSLDTREVRHDAESVQAVNDRIEELNDKLDGADRLNAKVESVDEGELDEDKRAEKQALLQAIGDMRRRLEEDLESARKQLAHMVAKEKMLGDVEHLADELATLIAETNNLLSDAEAIPNMYASTADAFVAPLQRTHELLETVPKDEPHFDKLSNLVDEAKNLHSQLLQRADAWREFVIERDTATDQLEMMRKPLDDIENQPLRSADQVLLDLDTLKNAKEELSELRTTMIKLQNLSEQLDPLESAYADVRFFDVDVEQTQQQFEDLMSLIDNELHDENILIESAQQLQRELERLEGELVNGVSKEQIDEMLGNEVPPLRAQLALLLSKDEEARETRVHVDRSAEPAIRTLEVQLARIADVANAKLAEQAEIERQERIVVIRLELEKLRSGPAEEQQLIRLEEQLQQLPVDDASTKALVAELQEIRVHKEQHEAVERALHDKLASISQRLDELDASMVPTIQGLDLNQQIMVLNSAIDELEHHILPQIEEISRDSQQEAVPLPALESEHRRTQMLRDSYQVASYCFSKKFGIL
uniref:KASH domain-containing protein n=1 Tax=Toxocara canis TaxID=6265 RepID=A0A183VG65_TOXCA